MDNGIKIKNTDCGMLINGALFVSDSVAESVLSKYFSSDYPADKILSELLEDTSFEFKEIIGPLKYCAVQIVGNGRRTTIEEHQKFMGCIKDFPRTIDLCEANAYDSGTLLSKILFSCFMTNPKLFKETMEYLINKRVVQAEKEIISGEKVVNIIGFGSLLKKATDEEKANELYCILKEYFDEVNSLYEKHKSEVYILSYDLLLSNCRDCAEAAFKETGRDYYKEEYAKHSRQKNKCFLR